MNRKQRIKGLVTVRAAIDDSPRDWPRHFTAAPEGFDRSAYQEKLDSVAGLSRSRSILRLEWGGEEQVTRYCEWNGSGAPTRLEILPKYRVRRRRPLGDGIEYIPLRRWVISQLYEWEQYGYGTDSGATFQDETGKTCKAFEKEKDYYTPLIYIGDHSRCPKGCCDKRLCFGDYKHPGGAEMLWVIEKTYLLQSERITDPRRASYSDAEKQRIAIEAGHAADERKRGLDSRLETITI